MIHWEWENEKNLVGKLACVLQLILSVTFIGVIRLAGVIPEPYERSAIVGLGVCLLLFFIMQFMKKTVARIFMILSFLVSICLVLGIYEVVVADQTVEKISNVDMEINNMVVVVKKNDPAENLEDASNYRFGIQTQVDRQNTDEMVKKICTIVNKKIQVNESENVSKLAQDLMDGKVEAAIYNENFNDMLEDHMEGYKDKVRILYQFGIKKKVKKREAEKAEPLKMDQKSFNVYISGIDVSGPIQTKSRSDVNIIASVNTDTKEILLTSTPRDYYVPIPEISGAMCDKLTHAGIYGVDASMRTLEQLYDIEIPYYVRVNFTSFVKLVDVIDGVDVDSEYAFTSKVGKYNFVEGTNHLDGKRALAFARERYSFADGDHQRGRNQQKVLTAIIQKVSRPEIVTNLNEILGQMGDCMQTNIPQETIGTLIKMQVAENTPWNVLSQSVTGTGETTNCFSMGSSYVYVMRPDDDSVDMAKEAIKNVMEPSDSTPCNQ